MSDTRSKDNELLSNLRQRLPELEVLLAEVNSKRVYEDSIYRFYHQSIKVFGLHSQMCRMVEELTRLAPKGASLSPMFEEIYRAGINETAREGDVNEQWTARTRPLLEAFFHARYFLEMAVKYGRQLQEPPTTLPSGWAALLCLYNFR